MYGDNLFGLSKRFINASFYRVDAIQINLNFKNYEKLKFLRNKAIDEGILTRSEDDEAITYILDSDWGRVKNMCRKDFPQDFFDNYHEF